MHDIIFAYFLIFFGASLMATLALYTRQSLIVAYIFLGILAGPYALKLIHNTAEINEVSTVGIMFLLFLLGLDLQPKNLITMLKGATLVTFVSAILFAVVSLVICRAFGYDWLDSVMVALAMMFSSTIIGLKLLPTTALHHQHIGEVVVSVLLMQDILAIIVLLIINFWSHGGGHLDMVNIFKTLIGMPLLVVIGYFTEKYILFRLFRRFNRIKEYLFLLTIGWCLGMAQLAHWFGLSYEIGAFIAGVAMASSPIAQYITECLKPLRDFFLIVFFFSVGAGFNFYLLPQVIWVVIAISLAVLLLKPLVYRLVLREVDESKATAWEIGFRLGQASEFSLLVAFLANEAQLISSLAYAVIQAVTIITFIVSSYWVVLKYPSPLALNPKLRRD